MIRSGKLLLELTSPVTIDDEKGGDMALFFTTDLDDTPSSYTGQAGKVVVVNGTPNGLEFVDTLANAVQDNITRLGDLTEVLTGTAFGINSFVAGGSGGQILRVQNTSNLSAAYADVSVGNDTSDSLLQLQAISSGAGASAFSGPNTARVLANGSGGLVLAALDGSGAVKFYAGGTGEDMRLHASGGLSLGNTTNPGAGNLNVNGHFSVGDGLADANAAGQILIANAKYYNGLSTGSARRALIGIDGSNIVQIAASGDTARINQDLQITGPRPWIDVRAHGATGNGSTDDTTAIQNALNAVPSTGGVVYFPAGTYKTSSTLTIPANKSVHIMGAGQQIAIIKNTSATASGFSQTNTTTPMVPSYQLHISDLSIATTVKTTGYAITVDFPDETSVIEPTLLIERVLIRPEPVNGQDIAWARGISISDCWITRIVDCTIHGSPETAGPGLAIDNMTEAIHLSLKCKEVFIDRCTIYWCATGIRIVGAATAAEPEGVVIRSTNIVSARDGINVGSIPQLSMSDCHINTVRYGVTANELVQSSIKGCNFYGDNGVDTSITTWEGISLEDCEWISVHANHFVEIASTTTHGLHLKGSTGTDHSNIIGNTGQNLTLIALIDTNSDDNTVIGNNYDGAGVGITDNGTGNISTVGGSNLNT